MVVVIGNNAARAFGLVGLGGFIRFRSGIKDTRDAAVMFVMIGIGMACGVGAVPVAIVATLFASVVLTIFDAGRRARLRMTKVAISATEPATAWERIRLAFPGARILKLPGAASAQSGKLVMEAALGDDMDAAGIMRLLEEKQVPGINSVSIDDNGKGEDHMSTETRIRATMAGFATLAALLALLVVGAAGCGGGSDTDGPPPDEDADAGPPTITTAPYQPLRHRLDLGVPRRRSGRRLREAELDRGARGHGRRRPPA